MTTIMLDERQRQIRRLRESGWSGREIARRLGIAKTTVYSTLVLLRAVGALNEPARTVGIDGKSRPARRAR